MHELSSKIDKANQNLAKSVLENLERLRSRQLEQLAILNTQPRFPPKHIVNTAEFDHPGGSRVRRTVHLYELSSDGIELVHRGYIHEGTEMSLRLLTNDGEQVLVTGSVCWCIYLTDQMHSIGVLFSTKVNPKLFVDETTWENISHETPQNHWNEPRTALQIQPSVYQSKAIDMLLMNANISCTTVDISGEAINRLQKSAFNLIILDDDINDPSCEETIETLQNNYYTGPILILTSKPDVRSDILLNAGATTIVRKPVRMKQFLATLRELFEEFECENSSSSPIRTSLSQGQCSDEQIYEYVQSAQLIGKQLSEALSCSDLDLIIELCNTLYMTGAGYGFESLTNIAGNAITSLRASCSVEESKSEIRKLIRAIGRLQSRDEYLK